MRGQQNIKKYNYDLPRLCPAFRLRRKVYEICLIYKTMGDIRWLNRSHHVVL